MTKVQIRFRLQRPLDVPLMSRVADAHSLYGIYRVKVLPGMEEIEVEYDASRLNAAQVESALAGAGVPIAPALA
jgi:hypothetical protein